jgi:2-dehydropantoate 2-reductase
MPLPRVLVLGTGALACVLGARLARSGRAVVTLAGTWTAALDAIAARGIRVEEAGGAWSAQVAASPQGGPLGPADLVLVAAKSHRTAAAARTAAQVLLPSGMAFTFQGGLGNREVLAAALAPGRVASGVAAIRATLLGPGHVRVAAPGRVFVGEGALARPLAAMLTGGRLEAEVCPEIERVAWAKLVVDCSLGPLSALTGRPLGSLLERPEPCETLLQAAREVAAVALASGIDLGGDAATLAVDEAERGGVSRSALALELERGIPTEVDALNGAVTTRGRELRVPTPVNEYLWHRIREREGRPVPPGA